MITENDEQPNPPDPGLQPPPQPLGPRRLTRSNDRRIAGVAGGVAEYFSIDPVIVRLAFVVAMFAGGAGLVGYLVAWVVLPEAEPGSGSSTGRAVEPTTAIAVALLAAAAWIAISEPFDADVVVPLILIGLGGYLLHQRQGEDVATEPAAPTEATTTELPRFADPRPAPPTGFDPTRQAVHPPPPEPPAPPRPKREPAVVTRACLSALALLFSAAIILGQLDWVDADTSTVIAIGLVVVGIATLVGSFMGRARGLIAIGVILGLAFATASVIEPVVEDGVGERLFRPRSVAAVAPSYNLGIGELDVDLRDLEIADGEEVHVKIKMGIGHTIVRVPPLVDLRADGHLDIGELDILNELETGLDNDVIVERDFPGDGLLILEIDMGIGQAEVRRG